MIACLDVHYAEETALAAAVVFTDWQATSPISGYTRVAPIACLSVCRQAQEASQTTARASA